MKPNHDKLNLGSTLNSIDGDNYNHGECFNYGSVGGCDENCPALLGGRCENPYDAIENCDISNCEKKEIIDKYQP